MPSVACHKGSRSHNRLGTRRLNTALPECPIRERPLAIREKQPLATLGKMASENVAWQCPAPHADATGKCQA